MVIINTHTKAVYNCSRVDASKILGVSVRTLYRWEKELQLKTKNLTKQTDHGPVLFTAMFTNVKKIKQRKGFALRKSKQ